MELAERTQWLRSGAPALLVRLSRAAGLAPLVYDSRGVRVSRALSIYGRFFIPLLSAIVLFCQISNVCQLQSTTINIIGMTLYIVELFEFMFMMLMNVYGAYFGSDRMKTWIDQVKRVEMVKSQLGGRGDAGASKGKEVTIIALSIGVLSFLLFTTLYINSIYASRFNILVPSVLTNLMSCLYYISCDMLAMQLILTNRYIASLLPRFNKSVHELYCDIVEDHRDQSGRYATEERVRKHQSTIRQLNTVYMEICALVDTMNYGNEGTLTFLGMVHCAAKLTVSPFNLINTLRTPSFYILDLVQRALWLPFNFIKFVMIVAPGHHIIEETEQLRLLVARLVGEARPCADRLRGDVRSLLAALLLHRPALSPLDTCTLSRGLLLSVMGLAVSYLVILVQFQSSE